ncbi:NADPH-dependent oxidoreductase [Vagococcus xieshaowenii]|uniref:NADPH-dependent oxidoreductase n=1 Tax=Vagococcus xieshaowenii TaxID=2562451 RepID=A0AAJ5EDF2_9ENTE|nr:NADPH-dependent oxidoreductase [Vagococcus xieshaowenii]QCA28150.1 NADPH-dependent oxidoreductase [Vagococcus xieshaowenii]TFZ39724.1 NADPH-dependent oxidoreductase [Vagococcus xieshaowenii]
MNKVIKKMKEHVSVREFETTPLSSEEKQALLEASQSGSSSNFVQAFSIIEITDSRQREALANITNSAEYVKNTGTFYMFVADLYRQAKILETYQQPLDAIKNMESLLVAVVDTTIAAEDMTVAAESMDLGICYIGGLRNDIKQVANLLDLPPFTVPLFGLSVGIPKTKNQVKPRLPIENQMSENTYDREKLTDLTDYEDITRQYYGSRTSNAQETSWSFKNAEFFGEVRRKEVAIFLKEQGFTLE